MDIKTRRIFSQSFQTWVALETAETLGNGALHTDFKLFISTFCMDILVYISTSQTLCFVLMRSNSFYKEQNSTE